MSVHGDTLALSLVSHTNVGKTTLARTLLGRDIGEVRDEAHVTEAAERHPMVESPEGDRLELWDTPGFGDSVRLARRLAQAGNPIGWFLSEVWDRFRDRAFWFNQRALRHVLQQSDLVLYLVNAAESPDEAGYVDPELTVLGLIGKPVIVLLNQLGPPQAPAEEAAELARWRERVARHPVVREVLALDAFARCWVQEGLLLQTVGRVLPSEHQATAGRLHAAWRVRQQATWSQAMALLAARLTRAALDRETLSTPAWSERLRGLGAVVGLGRGDTPTAQDAAMQALAERLDADIQRGSNQLIALHGLDGESGRRVLSRLAEHFALRQPVDEGRAAVLGGMVAGALAGLKADIASGGLTLGGGLLAGGVLGALGALGVARGLNKVRGLEQPTVAWSDAVLDELLRSSLLGYLAVVHCGRGRGGWVDAEHPGHWAPAVEAVVDGLASERQALWAERARLLSDGGLAPLQPAGSAQGRWQAEVEALLRRASARLLHRLYPEAEPIDA